MGQQRIDSWPFWEILWHILTVLLMAGAYVPTGVINPPPILETPRQYVLASRMVWNNKVWGTLCKSSSSEDRVLSAYSEQIERLKGWIETRMNSLKEEFDRL